MSDARRARRDDMHLLSSSVDAVMFVGRSG